MKLNALDETTPVLIQGITGRAARVHARLMREYGTRVVAGTTTGELDTVDGVPIFRNCRTAVDATGARVSLIMVPALSVLDAIKDAVESGIRLIVSVTEGMPVHDAIAALQLVRAAGITWIGPSTPGLCIPDKIKLGFIPDVALAHGHLAVMSKSGTLSYEVCNRLVRHGHGQSFWIGVGGDLVKGTRFSDLLPLFADDPNTHGIIVVGEIGGTEEEELASALSAADISKPVFVLIAGAQAKEGVTMGHAGALVHGTHGSVESKRASLTQAGAMVFETILDLVAEVDAAFTNRADSEASIGTRLV